MNNFAAKSLSTAWTVVELLFLKLALFEFYFGDDEPGTRLAHRRYQDRLTSFPSLAAQGLGNDSIDDSYHPSETMNGNCAQSREEEGRTSQNTASHTANYEDRL